MSQNSANYTSNLFEDCSCDKINKRSFSNGNVDFPNVNTKENYITSPIKTRKLSSGSITR